MEKFVNKLNILAYLLCFCVVLLITIVYRDYFLAWDDMYFSHIAIAFNDALWSLDLKGILKSVEILSKSPIMVMLSTPFVALSYSVHSIGISIAVLSFIIILSFYTVIRLLMLNNASPFLVLIALLSLFFNDFVMAQSGLLLVDYLFSLIVLILLLLSILEGQGKISNKKEAFYNSILWSVVLLAGVLSKVTFLYFAGLSLIYVAYRNYVKNEFFYYRLKIILLFLIPGLIVWLVVGKNMINHAVQFSSGPLAEFYKIKSQDSYIFWKMLYKTMSNQLIFIYGVSTYFIFKAFKREVDYKKLVALFIMIGYLVICSKSPNNDQRFVLPFMVSFPFLLICNFKEMRFSVPQYALTYKKIMLVFGLVLSALMYKNARVDDILTLKEKFLKIDTEDKNLLIITDSGRYNVETLNLVNSVLPKKKRFNTVSTTAYDDMRKLEKFVSIERVKNAHYIFSEFPLPKEPAFTNVRSEELIGLVLKRCHPEFGGEKFKLYSCIKEKR